MRYNAGHIQCYPLENLQFDRMNTEWILDSTRQKEEPYFLVSVLTFLCLETFTFWCAA